MCYVKFFTRRVRVIYMLAAFLAAVVMAVVMINDRLVLSSGDDPVLSNSLQALVISSTLPAGALIYALVGDLPPIPMAYTIGAFAAGAMWVVSNGAYFRLTQIATSFDEVAFWDAQTPIFIAILGLMFGIELVPMYWVGIMILATTLGSTRWLFGGGAKSGSTGLGYKALLVLHVGTLVFALLGFDVLLKQLGEESYQTLLVAYLSGQSLGFFALFSKELRANFHTDAPKIKRLWWALLVGETAYVISLALWTYSMNGYPGAATSALAGGYPLLILAAGPLVRRLPFFQRFGDVAAAFPPVEGSPWKKALILAGEAIGAAFLRPLPRR